VPKGVFAAVVVFAVVVWLVVAVFLPRLPKPKPVVVVVVVVVLPVLLVMVSSFVEISSDNLDNDSMVGRPCYAVLSIVGR
jgi:hypothetical protein